MERNVRLLLRERDRLRAARQTPQAVKPTRPPRGAGGTRRIAGLAIPFNRVTRIGDQFEEVVRPGAVDLVTDDDVALLWGHDHTRVLARTSSRTLRLEVRRAGVFFAARLPRWGMDHLETIQRGDVVGMSFGFRVTADDWTVGANGMPRREIRSMRLMEISVVTWPAYGHHTFVTVDRSHRAALALTAA